MRSYRPDRLADVFDYNITNSYFNNSAELALQSKFAGLIFNEKFAIINTCEIKK